MNVGWRLLLVAMAGAGIWTGNRLLISPPCPLRAAAIHREAPVVNQAPGTAIETAFGPIPPPGASSALPWNGFDASGTPWSFPPLNCWESVNLLTSGSADDSVYTSWPMECLSNLDDPATWDNLERTLRVGDVVEFIAHVELGNGRVWDTLFHVHLCIAEGGLMGGANNEPAFRVTDHVPYYTARWYVCTSRQYYAAFRAVQPVWAAAGRPQTCSVRVYRRPWWDDELSTR